MARLFGLVTLLLMMGGTAHAQPPVPSIDDYAAMSDMTSVRISPNGERIVFISGQSRAERSIVVYSLAGEAPIVIDGGDDQVLAAVSWANDENLLAVYSERREDGGGERVDRFRTYIVQADGGGNWELNQYASLANRDIADPDSMLVWLAVLQDNRGSRAAGNSIDRAVGLFRQEFTRDRARRRVFIGEGGFNYVLNEQNEPVVRYTVDDGVFELWSNLDGSGWERVYTENLTRERFRFGPRNSDRWTGRMTNLAGLDATGQYGYFTSRVNDDRAAVFRFNFLTNEIEGPVVQSDMADVGSFIRDWRSNAIIGVEWDEERHHVEYFDATFAGIQDQLEGFFPDSTVDIASWDQDFNKVLIGVSGGETSQSYYLLDRGTGQMAFLSGAFSRIPDEAVAPVEIVHFEARDGLDLFGYLTLPPGREARDLPLVMLPHGGPQARDFYGFDPWAQFLASRGYAVFQPQFRGSEGFGRDFITMAHGEWGRSMQDDISDALRHLVESGVVAQDRVCLFGWSYGGYAALAGATLTPELYRCIIAGAPVSQVFEMMNYVTDRTNGQSVTYWAEYIGDWRSETEYITRISPALNAGDVQAPLMLVHGTDDLIVPFEQAEIMAEAMDAAGKPYELVAIQDGPHQSYRMTVDNVRELYTNLERFLFEHNPPDAN